MTNRPVAGDTDDRILLVEDDAAQRVGLQQLLTSWGYAVDVAVNGADALAKVDEGARRALHEREGLVEVDELRRRVEERLGPVGAARGAGDGLGREAPHTSPSSGSRPSGASTRAAR